MKNEKLTNVDSDVKFNFWSILCLSLMLSFIVGSGFLLLSIKYLKNVTILSTFIMLAYIYFFQLIIEVFKNLLVFSFSYNIKEIFIKTFKSKFLLFNLLNFLCISICVLGFVFIDIFFNGHRIFLSILGSIIVGLIYFIYTIEVFNIIEYNNQKYNFEQLKKQNGSIFILMGINVVLVFTCFAIAYMFKYLHSMIFIVITLINFVLCFINKGFLIKYNHN